MIFSEYMLDAYKDIDEQSNFDHYCDDFDSVSNTNTELHGKLVNVNNVIGYGFPTCNKEETINTWINKHNENYDGTHYHHFLITKTNQTEENNEVIFRLFHSAQYFHTIESKISSEYCLDNAYKLNDTVGKNYLMIQSTFLGMLYQRF